MKTILVLATILAIVGALWRLPLIPRCKSGDTGIYIGGSVHVGGCPR